MKLDMEVRDGFSLRISVGLLRAGKSLRRFSGGPSPPSSRWCWPFGVLLADSQEGRPGSRELTWPWV